jgi:hypothetical protein
VEGEEREAIFMALKREGVKGVLASEREREGVFGCDIGSNKWR